MAYVRQIVTNVLARALGANLSASGACAGGTSQASGSLRAVPHSLQGNRFDVTDHR
jgi:hypothetical protein